MKANVKSNFNFKIPYEFDEPVNIWIDNFDGIEHQMEGLKIFRVENESEIIEICNSLTEEDYFSKIEVIEDNFNRALNWIDYPKRLKDKIEKLKVYE